MRPIQTMTFTMKIFDFLKHIHTIIFTFFALLFEYCKKSGQYIYDLCRYKQNIFYNCTLLRLLIFEPVGLFY